MPERDALPDQEAPQGWEDELNAAWAIVNQVRAENVTLKEEQIAFVRALEKAQAEVEQLTEELRIAAGINAKMIEGRDDARIVADRLRYDALTVYGIVYEQLTAGVVDDHDRIMRATNELAEAGRRFAPASDEEKATP